MIDGQQRLTTVQLLLEAFSDFCEERGIEDYDAQLRRSTRNETKLNPGWTTG